jgi:hypothetical protein
MAATFFVILLHPDEYRIPNQYFIKRFLSAVISGTGNGRVSRDILGYPVKYTGIVLVPFD